MGDPRPNPIDTFDPSKGYDGLLFTSATGGTNILPTELNEVQQIQDYYQKQAFDRIFQNGAIIGELGGTIGLPATGVYVGDDTLEAQGDFIGLETITYRIIITTGGLPGTAQFDYITTGDDQSTGPVTITAFNTWHNLGVLGAQIKFIDGGDGLITVSAPGEAAWILTCTYNRQLPTISGETITMIPATIYIDGKMRTVAGVALTYAPASTGKTHVFVEALTETITADEDDSLIDPLTLELVARRRRTTCTFKSTDTTTDPLPTGATKRIVKPVYEWDRETDQVVRIHENYSNLELNELAGVLLSNKVQHWPLSEELKGILSERTNDESGSYIVEERDLYAWIQSELNNDFAVEAAEEVAGNTGDDTATSGGDYIGEEDQKYTVEVTKGGAAGVAEITVTSTGSDSSGPTVVSAFDTFIDIGTLDAQIKFTDGGDTLLSEGDSWTVKCTYKTVAVQTNKGKSYVRGIQYENLETTLLRVPVARTTDSEEDEGHTFYFGANIYKPNKTTGNDNFPVKQFNGITAQSLVRKNITRGMVAGTKDLLLDTPVAQVLSVSNGTPASIDGTEEEDYDFSGTGAGDRKTKFTVQSSAWEGGDLTDDWQTIYFRPGSFSQEEVLEALNQGTGPAYASGSVNSNLFYSDDGSDHIKIQTLGGGDSGGTPDQHIEIGTDSANTILGYSNGATANSTGGVQYKDGIDYLVDGNYIDWSPGGASDPGGGTTYQVISAFTKTLLEKSVSVPVDYDYIFHGSLTGDHYYCVSVVRGGLESYPSNIVVLPGLDGDITTLLWNAVSDAQEYRIYHGNASSYSGMFQLAIVEDTGASSYSFNHDGYLEDDGSTTPNEGGNRFMGPISSESWVRGAISLNVPYRIDELGSDQIEFNRPFPGESINVDYDYYQPRYDRRVILHTGQIVDIRGVPSDDPEVSPAPPLSLSLAKILCPADSYEMDVENYNYRRSTQIEIRSIAKQVEDNRYNAALLNMIDQAHNQETAILRGAYAQDFVDQDQGDTGHPDYDCAVDPIMHHLQLPFETTTVPLELSSSVDTSEAQHGTAAAAPNNLIMLGYTDELEEDQDNWWDEILVNPHMYYEVGPKPQAWIILSPARDYWTDVTTIKSSTVIQEFWHIHVRLGTTVQASGPPAYPTPKWDQIRNELKFLREESARYARSIDVEVYGMNFEPNANVTAYFSNKQRSITPTVPWTGSGGKINADAFGFFRGTITIPGDTYPTGPHTIKAVGKYSEGPHIGDIANDVTATFTSEGEVQIFEEREIRATYYVDPIAQTFRLLGDGYISKIDIPLASKDDSTPLLFMLRNVIEGGWPGDSMAIVEARDPSGINVGESSHNYFYPEDPVFQKEEDHRAITLLSDSVLGYKAYRSRGGEEDHNGVFQRTHPYPEGSFMTSSNATTWDPKPDDAMRFKVYRAKFNASADLGFTDIAWDGHPYITGMMLMGGQEIPQGTDVQWEYRMMDQNDIWLPWKPIVPMTYFNLSESAKKIQVRAALSTTNDRLSPAIAKNTWAVVLTQNKLEGAFVDEAIEMSSPVDTVKVILEEYNPSGTGESTYGTVTSEKPQNYDITTGSNDRMKIAVDGGAPVEFQLANGDDQTATTIAAKINTEVGEDIATVEDGRVKLTALIAGHDTGTDEGSIELQAPSANSAYSTLGFRIGMYVGGNGGQNLMLSPDGGQTWMSHASVEDAVGDNGYTRRSYVFGGDAEFNLESIKLRIKQKTSYRYITPTARRLVATMS